MYLRLRPPIIVLILAATAVPVELRPALAAPGFGINLSDMVQNVIAYVPLGYVLAESGTPRALAMAAVLSMFAETSQMAMVHREPSLGDVLANVVGALVGAFAFGWYPHAT